MKAVAADFVFDGAALHRDGAVILDGADIAQLVPRREMPEGLPVQQLPAGAWLTPGFIDVQVNGGGDVLFNDRPTPEGIAAIARAHRRFGTTALLPTLITDTADTMRRAIAAVETVMAKEPAVLGIHLEGPFLNPERAGVHNRALIRQPASGDFELLTGLRGGVTLATLAPERVPAGFIRRLAQAGVRVALGHSAASYDETRAAIGEGLTGFTHLFNAMPPLMARAPGPVAAALEAPGVFCGLIVDGRHVAPPMLRLALRGAARPILVTDAMPPVGGMQAEFRLYGDTIRLREGCCERADGTLAGSALDMASALRNCVRLLGLPLAEALPLATTAPADFLGLGRRLGRLAPGCRADLAALDPEAVRVLSTWVAGVRSPASPPP